MLSTNYRVTMKNSFLSLALLSVFCLSQGTLQGSTSESDQPSKNTLEQISSPQKDDITLLRNLLSPNLIPSKIHSEKTRQDSTAHKKDFFAEDLQAFMEEDPWD